MFPLKREIEKQTITRLRRYEMMLENGIVVDAFHFPQCQARNRDRWEKKQCLTGFERHCWTVNVKNGKELDSSSG
jgi:hypothetical protein